MDRGGVCAALAAWVWLTGCGAAPPDVEHETRREGANVRCEGAAITWTTRPPEPVEESELVSESFGCAPAGEGVWQLVLSQLVGEEAASADPDEPTEPTIEGVYSVRFLALDGRRWESAPARFRHGGAEQWRTTIEALTAFDFDADGRGELVVRVTQGFYEGGEQHTAVLTAREGDDRATPYAAASRFGDAIIGVRDVDGDGRPDVVSCRPHCTGEAAWSESGGGWLGGPAALWQSMPDGTFSTQTPAARAHLEEECRDVGPPWLPELSDGVWETQEWETVRGHVLRAVTCAQLLDRLPSSIGTALRAETAASAVSVPTEAMDELDAWARQAIEAASAR